MTFLQHQVYPLSWPSRTVNMLVSYLTFDIRPHMALGFGTVNMLVNYLTFGICPHMALGFDTVNILVSYLTFVSDSVPT